MAALFLLNLLLKVFPTVFWICSYPILKFYAGEKNCLFFWCGKIDEWSSQASTSKEFHCCQNHSEVLQSESCQKSHVSKLVPKICVSHMKFHESLFLKFVVKVR